MEASVSTATVPEIARLCGVPAWRVRRLYETGRLPEPPRAGGYRLIDTADLPAIREALVAAGYLESEPGLAALAALASGGVPR